MRDDKQTYKAKFTLNGKKMKAEFDATGTLCKRKRRQLEIRFYITLIPGFNLVVGDLR